MVSYSSSCSFAHAHEVFNTGPYTISADNSIRLNRGTIQVVQWKANPGQGVQICEKNLPLYT